MSFYLINSSIIFKEFARFKILFKNILHFKNISQFNKIFSYFKQTPSETTTDFAKFKNKIEINLEKNIEEIKNNFGKKIKNLSKIFEKIKVNFRRKKI